MEPNELEKAESWGRNDAVKVCNPDNPFRDATNWGLLNADAIDAAVVADVEDVVLELEDEDVVVVEDDEDDEPSFHAFAAADPPEPNDIDEERGTIIG